VPIEALPASGLVPNEIGARSPAAALACPGVLSHLGLAQPATLRNRWLTTSALPPSARSMRSPRPAAAVRWGHFRPPRARYSAWERTEIQSVYHAPMAASSAGFEEVWSGEAPPYLQASGWPSAFLPNAFRRPLPATLLPRTPEPGRQRLCRRPPVSAGNEGHWRPDCRI